MPYVAEAVLNRWSDPPPADMKPDPDYEPEVGEWFWWWVQDKKVWLRRKGLKNGHTVDADNKGTGYRFKTYTCEALPATPPE